MLLKNLSLTGDLHFEVPRVIVRFETEFYTGDTVIHDPPQLHTIILEPDFPRIALVWHTALPCHSRIRKLKRTIVRTKRFLPKGVGGADALIDEEE